MIVDDFSDGQLLLVDDFALMDDFTDGGKWQQPVLQTGIDPPYNKCSPLFPENVKASTKCELKS